MFLNIALRWELSRPNFLPFALCRILFSTNWIYVR